MIEAYLPATLPISPPVAVSSNDTRQSGRTLLSCESLPVEDETQNTTMLLQLGQWTNAARSQAGSSDLPSLPQYDTWSKIEKYLDRDELSPSRKPAV